RYEQWLQGQGGLGGSRVNGQLLFKGKARCVTCHSGSNFTDESFHNTAQTDGSDGGRELVTGRRRFRGAFKTPTLREVANTGPYLHDGSAATIEAVIDLYNKGGNTATDRDSELRPLGLTDQEKSDLAAFVRALSSGSAGANPAPAPPPPPSAPAPATPAPAPGGDRLTNGGQLQPGGTLTSQNGRYLLAMQGDGNLVIYD